jgi:hypothetical protein
MYLFVAAKGSFGKEPYNRELRAGQQLCLYKYLLVAAKESYGLESEMKQLE